MLIVAAIVAIFLAGAIIPLLMTQVGTEFGTMDGQNVLGSVVPTFTAVFAKLFAVVLCAGAEFAGAVTMVLAVQNLFTRFAHWSRALARTRLIVPLGL